MPEPLAPRYDHSQEDGIYKTWEESGYFGPEKCIADGFTAPDAEPYTIVLPPPNVTGTLHMGHAAMLAIEDILIRYYRMKGRRTLWLPGTDSAAIATQSKVETEIYKKEGKTRHDLGREELLRRIELFTDESKDTILNQTKKMGSSLDWSRYAYTLDKKRYGAVMEAFKRMYDLGLIYRGARIVNWDPKLQTTVSDDEIEYVEEKAPFYHLKFGPFEIATSRPETKFGDKYVVMHPADERYAQYTDGQKIELEWINGPITATIVKDEAIDREFGTGVMTITPWHDSTDFDIAERHNLDKEQVIDQSGKLLPIAGEFAGMHIKKARPLIVEKLKAKGLVTKTDENYTHNVATNSRGGGVIEPQILRQWFVNVNKEFTLPRSSIRGIGSGAKTSLKEIMRKTVESGQITIAPERFEKTYFHWIDNLRDWCISRQIWYGHRIPVWYHDEKCVPRKGHEADIANCEEMVVSAEEPRCEYCDSKYVQDPDTLDTWFSSGLWTMSTLGWPEETEDLKIYHPTNLLETGYDIIFFWVARMILMTGCLMGDIPFRQVYLHGLVRDAKGKKMSKSLGNILDPLELIAKYGGDATRLSLIIGAGPGSDIKLSEDKVRGYRNFSTKIWNISRFVLMQKEKIGDIPSEAKPTEEDKRNLEEFQALKKEVSAHIENLELHLAAEKAYHYIWHTFADKVIETAKPRLQGENASDRAAAYRTLETLLLESLAMMHPFMPFVTEAVYQNMLPSLTGDDHPKLLMVRRWG